MRLGLRERNQFIVKSQLDSIHSTKMANSASSKYIDIFYLCDKLFIQDLIIIMKCEYRCDHILLKKYYGLQESPRKSYSANSFLEIRTPSKKINFQSNLDEVDLSSTIPDLKYTRQEQNSPERSSTYSQMMSPDEPAQLIMTTTIYDIDKEYLRNETKFLKKHNDKVKWFFSKLTDEQRKIFKKQWYQTMETMEVNIPMFTYFDIYASNKKISYPFDKINMFQKDWSTTSEKKVISKHPHLEEISIKVQNSEIIVSPFKTINPKED